jgi:uncharacterized membrane protein (UPF0136 family)
VLLYLPTLHDLLGAAGLVVTLALFLALGSAVTARRGLPEIQLVTGWGLVCIVLTVWGVLTPTSMAIPVAALGAVGLACLALPGGRGRIGGWDGIPRLLLLTLPLWLVMLPARPSQVDTWLNLLPNAAYLFDFGMLPTAHRPVIYSFLPVAPYNTQFAAYIASVVSGAFADSAMGLFNVALLCAAAMLFARNLAGRTGVLPWWACAAGLLLAVPLNPGFVPRVFFSAYGEAPLAVTTLFAVWLAVEAIEDLADGIAWPRGIAALALVLAAMVNTKQSGIGLVLPVGASMLVLALTHPRVPRSRAVAATVAALIPAIALYLIWRRFAQASFVVGELKTLPFSEWNIGLLPQIFVSILRTMIQKIAFFLCMAAVLAVWVLRLRRDPWSREGVLFSMIFGVILLFNGFLVFTYIAHFEPVMAADAHSFYRYNSQLSLLVILGLIVALRPVVAGWLTRLGPRGRYLAPVSVILVLALPFAIVGELRFDLETPQPQFWDIGHRAARHFKPGDKVALLVPGDDFDAVGSMLRGVILFTPPRQPQLDFRTETTADAATLDRVAAAGYRLALVSCTQAGLAGAPANVAALLADGEAGWQVVETWPYPPDIARRHFSALLARGPACASGER